MKDFHFLGREGAPEHGDIIDVTHIANAKEKPGFNSVPGESLQAIRERAHSLAV